MLISNAIQQSCAQYWQLARLLFAPLPLLTFFWWLAGLLVTITFIANAVTHLAWLALLSIVCLGVPCMAASAMVIPQLLVLISNFHLRLLDFRLKILLLLLIFSLLMSLLFAALLTLLQHNGFALALTFWSFFTCAVLPGVSLFRFSPLVVPIIVGFSSYLFAGISTLVNLHYGLVFAVDTIVWCAFAYWWMRFRPSKKYTSFAMNAVTLWSSENPGCISFPGMGIRNGLTLKAKSYVGSALLGHADGFTALTQRIFVTYVCISGFVVLFVLVMGPAKIEVLYRDIGLTFILFILLAPNLGYSVNIMKNFSPVWLLFPGDRLALLRFAERLFWKASLLWYLPTLMLWLLANYVVDFFQSTFLPALLFLLAALCVQAACFYIFITVYRHMKHSSTGSLLAIILPVIAAFSLGFIVWVQWPNNTVFALKLTLWTSGVFLLAALVLRMRLLTSWAVVDLARMKN